MKGLSLEVLTVETAQVVDFAELGGRITKKERGPRTGFGIVAADWSGSNGEKRVRNEFYKDTQGVILVYDVGQKDSFDALDAWLAEMKQDLGPHGNMENIVFAVCANKIDCAKHRCVDESEGRLWAESKGFLYFETSAQTGEGISEMFQ
ncbi:hypothetical protein J1605_018020, partial [Eschrichtius robustus]